MANIDQRVVTLKLDNSSFQKNANETIKTIEKLNQAITKLGKSNTTANDLNKALSKVNFNSLSSKAASSMAAVDKSIKGVKFDTLSNGASQALSDIEGKANSVTLSGIASAVDAINTRFSTLKTVAIGALSNIASQAVSSGAQLVKSFTLQPIIDGFQEYETQLNSVQTILANTASKGTNIDQVNQALDNLNTYADKTIYNFSEMTRNIGTFTAAGVDLDKSVDSIKGIANLAAMSGSSSQQASTAMYQLSQAIAAGKVSLMDWNSVVNAGMGGEVFQKALIRTSDLMKSNGKSASDMIKKYGTFRESLTQGEWLTTDVLTETLKQLSGAYTEADLMSQGYTKQQAKDILQMAKTAEDAATKVKTFSQLIDTLKEAVGSGWATTFRTLFGDFEQSKELWTNVSNVLGDIVNKSSDARNALVKTFVDMGGRQDIIDGIGQAFNNLMDVLGAIGKAWSNVFPAITAQQLKSFSEGFKNLMENMKPTESTLNNLQRVFQGIFSVVHIVTSAIGALASGFAKVLGVVMPVSGGFLSLLASIADYATALDQGISKTKFFQRAVDAVVGVISGATPAFEGIKNVLSGVGSVLTNVLDGFKNFNILGTIMDKFSSAAAAVSPVIQNIANTLKTGFTAVIDWAKENLTFGNIMGGLVGGGALILIKKIMGMVDAIKEPFEKITSFFSGEGEKAKKATSIFDDVLGNLSESLQAFTGSVKAFSLIEIAAAVALLVNSLTKLSKIDPAGMAQGLVGLGVTMAMMNKSLATVAANTKSIGTAGLLKAAASMVVMAEAMNILADAITKMGSLSIEDLAKGLAGMGVSLFAMSKALKAFDKKSVSLKTSVALIAMAKAIKMLADAVSTFAVLSWEEIARGLTAMGGALIELSAAMAVMSKVGGARSLAGAVSMVVAVQALAPMVDALQKLSSLSWDGIGKGLTAMGGALAEFTVVLAVLSKFVGFKGLAGATALVIAVQALAPITDSMQKLSSISWEGIAKGLVGMGAAITELAAVAGILGKLGGMSAVTGAAAVVLMAQSLEPITDSLTKISHLSWDGVAKGLVGMGAALAELAVVSGVLGKLAGASGLLGAATILVAVQSLDPLANALIKMGAMSWDDIGRGLTTMGVALTELAVVSGILGKLAGMSGLLGAATILVAVQSLDPLANALSKMGSMSWDKIGRGLVAMGGALAELAVVSGVLGTLAGLPALLGAGALLAGVQSLGTLADSLKKFGTMSWDEIKQGLTAMAGALGTAGLGMLLNTLSGFGAGAVAKYAGPLGTLADSVKKWGDVKVPDSLGPSLSKLAGGIMQFTFGGWGADAFVTMASGMKDMASGVEVWSKVSVPDNIGDQLTKLADGVKAFTLGGWGADAAKSAGPALKSLAEGVNAWKDVDIKDNIGDTVRKLGDGITSFDFAGWGADAANTSGPALEALAKGVNAWHDVDVPDGIGDAMAKLANGVSQFTLSGWGADAAAKAGPALKDLAEGVNAWHDVDVPEGIGDNLKQLGDGIGKFNFSGWGADAATTAGPALKALAEGVDAWHDIDIPEDIGSTLTSLGNGINSFNWAGWGADAATTSGPALTSLANGVKSWTDVQIPENIGGTLTSLANGINSFNWAGWGADAATSSGPALTALANGVKSWTDVQIPENLGSSLTTLAYGIQSFTFSGWGANDASAAGPALTSLANGVRSWTDVQIPENMGPSLSSLASGIQSFTFSGWGANDASAAGPALTSLANGVRSWSDLELPENIGPNLSSLASGIQSFTFSGWGANDASAAGPALTALASGVDDFSDVHIPTNIGDQLSSLSSGISSFTFGRWGAEDAERAGNSIRALGDGLRPWSNMTLPGNLGGQLTDVANGIKSFGGLPDLSGLGVAADGIRQIGSAVSIFGLMSGSSSTAMASLSSVLNTLNNLPAVNTTLPAQLQGLATSVQSSLANMATSVSSGSTLISIAFQAMNSNLTTASSNMGLAVSTNLNTLSISITGGSILIVSALNSMSAGISMAMATTAMSISIGAMAIVAAFTAMNASMSIAVGTASATISMAMAGMSGAITAGAALASASVSMLAASVSGGMARVAASMSAGAASMSMASASIGTAMNISVLSVTAAMARMRAVITAGLVGCVSVIINYAGQFYNAGRRAIDGLVRGISTGNASVRSAVQSVMNSATGAIGDTYSSFYSAGANASRGLANGISSGRTSVAAASASVAAAAVAAAQAKLQEHSPSRVFIGIGKFVSMGLANGISDNANFVTDSVNRTTTSMIDQFNAAISGIGDGVEGDLDINPTITPVLDLSAVTTDAEKLTTLLDTSTPRIKASVIGAPFKAGVGSGSDSSNSDSSKNGTSLSFVQNNYSPKSLSRIDIYRDTKNQFSQLKGVLDKI